MRLPPLLVRTWLNKRGKQSTASVFIDFAGADLAAKWADAISVHIADCDRSISLEFPVKNDDYDSLDNSLYKIRKLQDALA